MAISVSPSGTTGQLKTYDPIVSYTVPSNTTEVNVGSIPQGYKDLVIVVQYGDSNPASLTEFWVNNQHNTNTLLSHTYMVTYYGLGSPNPRGGREGNVGRIINAGYSPASALGGLNVWHIGNYSSTTNYKQWIMEYTSMNTETVETHACAYRSNDAITSFGIGGNSGATISAGSTIHMYGLGWAS
jgi:hypothetical protein